MYLRSSWTPATLASGGGIAQTTQPVVAPKDGKAVTPGRSDGHLLYASIIRSTLLNHSHWSPEIHMIFAVICIGNKL